MTGKWENNTTEISVKCSLD